MPARLVIIREVTGALLQLQLRQPRRGQVLLRVRRQAGAELPRAMVDLREGDAVGDDRLAEQLVGIGHDMGGAQQVIIRHVADSAPMLVGSKHAVPEGCRM